MNAPVRDKLHAAIAEAWAQAESNEQARDRLLAIMQDDPEVLALATEPHLPGIAAQLTARHKIARRAYLWSRPSAPDARVSAMARINAVSLLDMRLPSGKRLGDATGAEVAEAADYYAEAARRHNDKARFFRAVVSRVGAKKTVGDVLTDAELEEIKDA